MWLALFTAAHWDNASTPGKEGPAWAGPVEDSLVEQRHFVPGVGRWAGVSRRCCSAAFSAS